MEIRREQGSTVEKKEQQVLEILYENFLNPVIRGINVPVFFTDYFDLGKEYDLTGDTI